MNVRVIITTLLAVSLALYIWLAWSVPGDTENGRDWLKLFTILSQALFVIYLFILVLARHLKLLTEDRCFFYFILTAALIIRLVVITGADGKTALSDDVYRYAWEGRLVANGYNPYMLSPDDLSGSALVDEDIYPNINNRSLPTIYSPLSQYLFALAYYIDSDSIHGFKIIAMLFDLLTIITLFMLAQRLKLPPWTVLIYILSPLVIIEFIYSSHLDILAMPFFVLALLAVHNKKAGAAGLMIALAALVKLFALLILPFLLWHFRKRQRLIFGMAFILTFVLFYLPFIATAGTGMFGSLWDYLSGWRYNGSIYTVFHLLFSEIPARIICGTLFAATMATIIFYRNDRSNPLGRIFAILGAYIILAPTLFPWYLVWIFPFLMINRNRAFLILTGAILLTYLVGKGFYYHGQWPDYWPLSVIQYMLFYTLLIWQHWPQMNRWRIRLR